MAALFSAGRLEDRIEGLRSRVGGAVADAVDIKVEHPGSDINVPLSLDRFSFSFLEVGLGGGL